MNLLIALGIIFAGTLLFIWSTTLLPSRLASGLTVQILGIASIAAGLYFLTDIKYVQYAALISFVVIAARAATTACHDYEDLLANSVSGVSAAGH